MSYIHYFSIIENSFITLKIFCISPIQPYPLTSHLNIWQPLICLMSPQFSLSQKSYNWKYTTFFFKPLNDISLYQHSNVCLSIPIEEHFCCLQFWAIMNRADINILMQLLMEKAMAPHSSTLAQKIPQTEEPGRLQSMGSRRVRHLLSDFPFTFHFPALEKEMATHSSVLAWRIPGTGEPGGLLSLGSHRVGHD